MRRDRFGSDVEDKRTLFEALEEIALDREWKEWSATHGSALESLSEDWQYWLYRVYFRMYEEDGTCAPRRWQDFLECIANNGLYTALLVCLDRKDYYKERDAWLWPSLPDIPWPVRRISVLQEILKTKTSPLERQVAAKWLPYQTEIPSEAVEILIPLLADPQEEVQTWSAIHLAHLSPDALTCLEPLRKALGHSEFGWGRRIFNLGCSCAGEAAIALAQLGTRVMGVVPDIENQSPIYWNLHNGETYWYNEYDLTAAQVARVIIRGRSDEMLEMLLSTDKPSHYYWSCWFDMGWAALPFLRVAKQHESPRIQEFAVSFLKQLASIEPRKLNQDPLSCVPTLPYS